MTLQSRQVTKVLVTGGTGLVGGAVCRHLEELGYEVVAPSRSELDLTRADETHAYLEASRPQAVVAAAALVGGIGANLSEPTRFLTENLTMQNNLLLASAASGVSRLIFMSSSCVYPRDSPQPMKEDYFLTGPFEPTNASYAVAKMAGMQLASSLASEGRLQSTVLVPSNIYGPGDTFDLDRAHVASALVRKFVDARRDETTQVEVWGTGRARRELLHVSDIASATAFVLCSEEVPFLLNVGTGQDHSISELAIMIKELTGFTGSIRFDATKPDGMPRKVLDVSRLRDLGWTSTIELREGLAELVSIYENQSLTSDSRRLGNL